MKTKRKLVAGIAIYMAFFLSLGIVACRKDEPTPEIVVNPLDEEGYYILGKVNQSGGALEGVTVRASGVEVKTAADGSYQLEVRKKGDYLVSFAKEGYVPVSAEVEIPLNVKKRSAVTLLQEMMIKNASVHVSPDADASIPEANKKIASLAIFAGSLSDATDISITEFLQGRRKVPVHVGLSTIYCEPDDLTFKEPAIVKIKNQTSSQLYFAGMKHFVERSGKWTKVGDLNYDVTENVYTTSLSGFSNHSFGPLYVALNGETSLEKTAQVSLDNLGKMGAIEEPIHGVYKTGWMVDGDLKALLRTRFPALNTMDLEQLALVINQSIASLKGSSAGINEGTLSMGMAKLSGDMKMTVAFMAMIQTTHLSFELMYQQAPAHLTVPVRTYSGVSTELTYQYGVSHTDHSGGSIQ